MDTRTSHRPPGVRRRYTVRAVREAHLDRHDRRRLGALLADAFGDEEVRRDAHYGDPPRVRLIARDRGTPVAQAGLFRLHASPSRHRVFGIGDVAVAVAHRHQGLARATVGRALALAHAQRPDLIVARTDPLRALLARHGFVAIDAAAIPALEPHENWMAWIGPGGIPPIAALDPADV